jgi:endonuclease III
MTLPGTGIKFRQQQLDLVREMRQRRLPPAPVDVIGCDCLADKDAPEAVRRFQTLLALMLSSQTKDEVTAAAMARLKASCAPQLLCPAVIRSFAEAPLAELLKPVGFYRRKAKALKETCELLALRHNDDIPNSVEGLTALPGVGPKMVSVRVDSCNSLTDVVGVLDDANGLAQSCGDWRGCPCASDMRATWLDKRSYCAQSRRHAPGRGGMASARALGRA